MSAVHKGKKLSDEHKTKLSASQNKKQVYCVELDRVFESISAVSKALSLPSGHISSCCLGKRKTCGGYHFEYYSGV